MQYIRKFYFFWQTLVANSERKMATSGNLGNGFVWNEALNVIFSREIQMHRPYQFRAGSKESSSPWGGLLETLNW